VVVSVNVLENSKEIAILGTGEIFGEMSFIDNRPPSATVETTEESLVLSLPRSLLTSRLVQDVGFSARFNRAIALFLSSRLRIALTELDFGKDFIRPDEELSPVLLENLPLARARFDWLLRRVKNSIQRESLVTNY
jgi:CRP-like cAMP-binding protein